MNNGKFKIKIIIDEKVFKNLTSKFFLDFMYKKINWCKCLLSGEDILLFLNSLLTKENKFSKAGYHKRAAT